MSYEPTSDEDVVKIVSTIDISALLNSYQQLKLEFQSLLVPKIEPDLETLEVYNKVVKDEEYMFNDRVRTLYLKIKPIKDAGLLPAKYDNEYTQLENYVNNI